MSNKTKIETIRSGWHRPMSTNSTSTTLGGFGAVVDRPATVEGTSAVFETQDNHLLVQPILVGADNVTGLLQLLACRPAHGPLKRTITGVTQANPAVVTTSAAHGYSTGDRVLIEGIVGMTELNGRFFTVTNVTGTTFSLDGEDSTAHAAWSSGGTTLAEQDRNKEIWKKSLIGIWVCTASTVVGVAESPQLDTERSADTIVPSGIANNSQSVTHVHTPANNSEAHILIDALGFPLIEATFDRDGGGGTTATSMNALFATL